MKKNRVAIICVNKKNSIAIKGQLDKILGELIDFECYDLKDTDSFLGSNLFLVSGNKAAKHVSNLIMDNSDILIMRRTIKKENHEKILNIKEGSKILVVNDDQEMAEATISLLYELGLKNNELIPYFPGCDYVKGDFELAITPNEVRLVPYDIKEIMNIGTRIIDPSTIFDILFKLGLISKATIKIVNDYSKNSILLSPSLGYLLNNLYDSDIDYVQILNNIDYGIIIYDRDKKISFYNKETQRILTTNGNSFKNYTYDKMDALIKDINVNENVQNIVHKINGNLYLISNYIFFDIDNIPNGGMLKISDYRNLEKILYSVKNLNYSKLYLAKHTFEDIIGESIQIKKNKEVAMNFALSEAPIMIQGESGTGKELFAQSIHNSSTRKSGPFVAFNCAALSESLIESELFGYEAGAFTGAKKEGKVGLFELANGGTIFLDEIGDLPVNLQAKLLRVLQEGEFMRVGGTEIIPINVRIISATNKDLVKLINEKRFRSDLYYRLNVLPLYIEPFRNRRVDIKCLFDFFYKINNMNKDISKSVIDVLLNYNWPGNGREIRNCVEYLCTINKNCIRLEDIPKYLIDNNKYIDNSSNQVDLKKYDTWLYILMILKDAKIHGKKLGRKSIINELKTYSVYKTESEIRILLQMLSNKEFVISTKGRGGTQITDKGIKVLEESFV